MRWFSRVLTQSHNLSQFAYSNSSYRTRQRNRRNQRALLSSLETLEHRRLLSGGNVTVTYASGALSVAGDTHNDSFSVTENASGGTVTVASTAK